MLMKRHEGIEDLPAGGCVCEWRYRGCVLLRARDVIALVRCVSEEVKLVGSCEEVEDRPP